MMRWLVTVINECSPESAAPHCSPSKHAATTAAHPPTRLDVSVQDAVGVALRQCVQHRAHVASHLQGSGTKIAQQSSVEHAAHVERI